MTKQITLEEALKLVSFHHITGLGWQVRTVFGNVAGNVDGYIGGDIYGNIKGIVFGDIGSHVSGDVFGNVGGTINGREWKSVETPKDKLQRLITESGNQELIDTFNQMENN